MKTQLEDGQTLLFIGDSITDCGRRDKHAPLGCGYVEYVNGLLIAEEPEKHVSVINRGIGGNTAEDLRSRWEDDVLQNKPDWLSIKIGINDINQYACDPQKLLSPQHFEDYYQQLLELTQARLPDVKLLLIDPFYISHDQTPGSYRKRILDLLPDYLAVVARMAERFETRHVKTHTLFQEHLRHRRPDELTPEPVHPHAAGHMIIARAVLRALSGAGQ